MDIQSDGFEKIELTNGAKTARISFSLPDKTTVSVEMPIEKFALGVSETLRIVESANLQRDAASRGIQAISFSTVQTIEPRADVLGGRLYLLIDQELPHRIAYGFPMLKASQLGLAIYTEVEKLIAAAEKPGTKQ